MYATLKDQLADDLAALQDRGSLQGRGGDQYATVGPDRGRETNGCSTSAPTTTSAWLITPP